MSDVKQQLEAMGVVLDPEGVVSLTLEQAVEIGVLNRVSEPMPEGYARAGGLWRTSDGGETWDHVPAGT